MVGALGWHVFPREAASTRAPTTAQPAGSHDVGKVSPGGGQQWWPEEWGIVVWLAIIIATGFLLLGCCCLMFRCRRRFQRVHVAPQSGMDLRMFRIKEPHAVRGGRRGGDGSVKWDFAKAGTVGGNDLEAAKLALEALRAEATTLPPRCLTFWASNHLRVPVLAELDGLLAGYAALTLSFDADDWRRADDATMAALARLLMKYRGRCKFRTGGSQPLALPLQTQATLGALGDALAASHNEVDSVIFEKGPRDLEPCRVSFAALRLSSQEVAFNRQPLGDMGCALVCGFVRSWGARLQIARLVECGLGDLAISSVSRLLAHAKHPATGLRELNLSANKFGDRGVAELADALPLLDSLEKLLLDRNNIGPAGAQVLAARLPRSNVRELVMGTHLGGNAIGPAGVQALAGALSDGLARAAANRATRLEALALDGCGVAELGAQALAESLPKSALMALSVARGGLGDNDATAILLALPNSIAFLDMSGNELSDLTASIAGEALYKRPGMSVNLAANYLSSTIKMLLAEESMEAGFAFELGTWPLWPSWHRAVFGWLV
ncbi:unnamed protein product [Effrenium voratum]|nr:unnamed protein product [Effrenium voratum]